MDNPNREEPFYILTIDGGGIRGVYPAYILLKIQEELKIRLDKQFSLIAGTSTGSIIAATVAEAIDLNLILQLYREYGPKIFNTQKSNILKQLCQSKYNKTILKERIQSVFGNRKLGEVVVPLMIPATDIGNGTVHVFKSSYCSSFVRDKDVLLKEAVMASCSAPLYFDPSKVDSYLLSDGGLWANNPSLAAVIDANKRLGVNLEDIRILSIGTGIPKRGYGVSESRKWGILTGWSRTKLVDLAMSLQSQSAHNYLGLLLKENQILRLNFESDLPLTLDDCSKIEDLISRADKEFTNRSAEIKDFLSGKRREHDE